MTPKLSYAHFHPYSLWSEDPDGRLYINGKKQFIVDQSTGDRYLNEDLSVIKTKCFLLLFGTPIVHAMAVIVKIVFNLLKLISFYDFWKSEHQYPKENESNNRVAIRVTDASLNVANIIFAPVAILLLEFSALYGMIMPLDGRKLYANVERFTYGHFVLAPCFQPTPEKHLFGGDLNVPNAF